MNNEPVLLTEDAAARVLAATRYVEGVPRLDRRFARRGAPAGQSGQSGIVVVTGSINADGLYPGVWYDLLADTLQLDMGEPCWVWPLNRGAPKLRREYHGRLWADHTTDDDTRPVFTVDSCCDVPPTVDSGCACAVLPAFIKIPANAAFHGEFLGGFAYLASHDVYVPYIGGCVWQGNFNLTTDPATGAQYFEPGSVAVKIIFGSRADGQGDAYFYDFSGEVLHYLFPMTASDCCEAWTGTITSQPVRNTGPTTIGIAGICDGVPDGSGSAPGSITSSALGTAFGVGVASATDITVEAGTMLEVLVGTTASGGIAAVTFGGVSLAKLIDSTSSEDCELWYLHVTATTTGTISAVALDGTAVVMLTVREVLGLANFTADAWSFNIDSTGLTDPDSGATPTTAHAAEFALAGAMVKDVGAGGSWTGSGFTAGQSVSVTTGGHTYKLLESWKILSSVGTPQAVYAGASPQPAQWGAVVGTIS